MTATTARIAIRRKYAFVTVALLLVAVCTPVVAWAFLLPFLPAEWLLVITLLALLFDIVFGRALSSCNQRIELDGGTIRVRKLLTRRVSEWQVRDIVNVKGTGLKELGLREAPVTDESTRWRHGYVIEFKDGQKLLLSRHEMAGMGEFLVALADRIERVRAET